jgi:hypothetical protein
LGLVAVRKPAEGGVRNDAAQGDLDDLKVVFAERTRRLLRQFTGVVEDEKIDRAAIRCVLAKSFPIVREAGTDEDGPSRRTRAHREIDRRAIEMSVLHGPRGAQSMGAQQASPASGEEPGQASPVKSRQRLQPMGDRDVDVVNDVPNEAREATVALAMITLQPMRTANRRFWDFDPHDRPPGSLNRDAVAISSRKPGRREGCRARRCPHD